MAVTAIDTGQVVSSVSAIDDGFGSVRYNKVSFLAGGGAESDSGVLMGGGTSADPQATSVADAKFLEFRCKTTAASGDNRLAYLRYEIGGAGGGEALRAFSTLSAASGTCHGAHLSLIVSSTGYISGLGVGARATLQVGNSALPAGGTYYGAQVEIYSDGASSSVAAVTKHAILNVAANGNSTGKATVLNAIAFDGTSAADTTKMISSVSLAELPAGTVGIAVLVNGTRYYVPAVAVAEWN